MEKKDLNILLELIQREIDNFQGVMERTKKIYWNDKIESLESIKKEIEGIPPDLKEYRDKWYFRGSIIGIFAGIAIGWIMFG